MYAAMFAFVIAGAVVLLSYQGYFAAGKVAPVDRVYVATIKAGASWDVATQLLIWAIPGALVQFLGGPKRQIGVLFATGLLLLNPIAGWAVLVGVVLRTIWMRLTEGKRQSEMEVFAAGIIAGDALYGFYDTVSRTFFPKK